MGRCKFNEKRFEKWLALTLNEARSNFYRKTLGTMGVKALESHLRSHKNQRYAVAAAGLWQFRDYLHVADLKVRLPRNVAAVGFGHGEQTLFIQSE